MSNSEVHCCEKNKCTGEVYRKWALNCKFCEKKVYVQCMRKRDEYTKQILMIFGLGEFDSTGTFRTKSSEADNEHVFYKAFNMHSPFGITCEVCTSKFREILGKSSTEGTSSAQSSSTDTKPDSMPVPNLKPPEFKQKHTSLAASKATIPSSSGGKHEEYAIYVSKFHPTTNCNDISGHISSKTNITDCNHFTVTKLLKRRVNFKFINFVSFKITTTDKVIYDTILNDSVWGPEFKAIPFDSEHSMKPKHPPKVQNGPKDTKTNSKSSKTAAKSVMKPISMKKTNERIHKMASSNNNMERKAPKSISNANMVAPVINNERLQYPTVFPHPAPSYHQFYSPMPYHGNVMYHSPVGHQSNFYPPDKHPSQYRAHQTPWLFPPHPQWLPYY